MTYTIEKVRTKTVVNERKRLEELRKNPMYAIFGDYEMILEKKQQKQKDIK